MQWWTEWMRQQQLPTARTTALPYLYRKLLLKFILTLLPPFLALLILSHTTFHIHCPGLIAAYHQPQGAIGIVLHGSTLLTNARLQGKLLLLLLHRFLTTATNNNTTNTNTSAWLLSVLLLPLIPHHDRDYYYFYRILVESAQIQRHPITIPATTH